MFYRNTGRVQYLGRLSMQVKGYDLQAETKEKGMIIKIIQLSVMQKNYRNNSIIWNQRWHALVLNE